MARTQRTQFFDHVTRARQRFGRVIQEIAAGLEALHRVQFDEPWKSARRPTHGEW